MPIVFLREETSISAQITHQTAPRERESINRHPDSPDLRRVRQLIGASRRIECTPKPIGCRKMKSGVGRSSVLRQEIIDPAPAGGGGSAAGQGHPVLSTGSGDRFQGPAGWDLKGF